MKTIILNDEQYASLQAALNYAAEQRFYEASQTADGVDRVEIEAGAHEWEKLQDLLQSDVASASNQEGPGELHLMTIAQFAEFLASHLNYRRIWESKFPICDFTVANVQEVKQYSQKELEELHPCANGWYGIKSVDYGFDSTTLYAVADLYGGGCDQVCRLYDGIGVIEAECILREAIKSALTATDELVLNTTVLLVEIVFREVA